MSNRIKFLILLTLALSSFSDDGTRKLLYTHIQNKTTLGIGILDIKKKFDNTPVDYLLFNLDSSRIQMEFDSKINKFLKNSTIPKNIRSLNFIVETTRDSSINNGYYTPYIQIVGTNTLPKPIDNINLDCKDIDWKNSKMWFPKNGKIYLADFDLIGKEISKDLRVLKSNCEPLIFIGITNLLLINSQNKFNLLIQRKDTLYVNSGGFMEVYTVNKIVN